MILLRFSFLSSALCLLVGRSYGFVKQRTMHHRRSAPTGWSLSLQPEFLAPDEDNDNDDDDRNGGRKNETLVTKEMFLRDLLQDGDPKVKRKGRKGGGYKVLDNRDSLPFAIRETTPDPYTHPDVKRKKAARAKQRGGGNNRAIEKELLASKLYRTTDGNKKNQADNNNDDTRTPLGEFYLDKHTTTGDLLEIANVQYKVVRHRCQYKYAGGMSAAPKPCS